MGADNRKWCTSATAVALGGVLAGLSACAPPPQHAPAETVSAEAVRRESSQAVLPKLLAETLAAANKVQPDKAGTAEPTTPTRLTRDQVLALAKRCAPGTPASRLLSIARIESGLDPLAININGPGSRHISAPSREAAIARSIALVRAGASIDIGLAQINNRTISRLNYPLAAAFDPCINLKMAAEVLNAAYARALQTSRPTRPISETAYSFYNSGDPDRSVRYGYAARATAAFHADQTANRH